MNRASRHEAMFTDDTVCALFTDTLAELPQRFGVVVHGYALMPNHFHLMVEVPRGNLSAAMRHLSLVFTQAFNRLRGHDGAVFRGRFHNQVVTDDAYWEHLLAYLHLNPVRARLAKRPEDCIWTSHNAYIGESPRPSWLTTSDLLGRFGSPQAVRAYVDGVRTKRQRAPASFDPEAFWRAPSTEEMPEPAHPEPRSWEQALADVAGLLDLREELLLERRHGGPPNVASWLAIWWLLRSTGLSQSAVARQLGLSRARVSQVVARFLAEVEADPALGERMAELEAMLQA